MKFMNNYKWNYQNPADAEGSADVEAAPEKTETETIKVGEGIDYNKLALALTKVKQQQPKDDYTEHVNSDKKADDEAKKTQALSDAIKFNTSFADVLQANKSLFPDRTSKLLDKDFSNETTKAETLQKFAARDFFGVASNLELLSASEKNQVEKQLINDHGDVSMSGADAWNMVERALHIHGIKQDKEKIGQSYSGKDNGEMSGNIKAFHEKAYPKDVVSLS